MMQLTAKAGPSKGVSWELGEQTLVVGRAATCDIRVSDPTVSRRHCEIVMEGDAVVLRDLESSNTTLVNGLPVKRRVLAAGDEIAVGSAVFLVTNLDHASVRVSGDGESAPETLSLSEGEAVYLGGYLGRPKVEGRPQTVQDLALLFSIGRELSRVTSLSELFDTLMGRLRERFSPSAAWLARVYEDNDLVFVGSNSEATAPLKLLRTALAQQRGLLVTNSDQRDRGVLVTTLVAPMGIGGERVGAVAMEKRSSDGIFNESDLELLVALTHTVAPFIHAVERVEWLRQENARLQSEGSGASELVGASKGLKKVKSLARKAATSDLSVLILGETGTGKELVARMVHHQSARRGGQLVVVNCAAIPSELLESELFGYEAGAFTGASRRKEGLIEQAHQGTLFLDEIGDLSRENQARILRAVELGAFHRVGAKDETQVDIRVVCATNKDIARAVARNEFRSDLYHRLNGFEIHVPPLRDRVEDIPPLVEHFLRQGQDCAKHAVKGVAPEALDYLRGLPWPGNVRELRSVVFRAIALSQTEVIQLAEVRAGEAPGTAKEAEHPYSLAAVEKQHITVVLRECGGNISNAARLLEISRNTLYNKIADYGINVS